jgi:hypothetical protein
MNPELTVQRQLLAYNAHDIDGFVATYAADAELFLHPDKLLARGIEQIRDRYTARFKDAKPNAVILKRIVAGNKVIDEEEITASSAEGTKITKAVAIYEVSGDKISRAWFI